MNKRNDILLYPGFLIGLFLLLANDFFFKNYFHNALTGKLSDIAGLFIFPLFISAILRSHSKHIFFCVALFFVYWKSPLSDPLLNALSFLSGLNFERVVDYTDLFCLPVLGLSYRYLKSDRKQVNFSRTVILLCSAFAFIATSPRREAYSEIERFTLGEGYKEVALQKSHMINSSRFLSVGDDSIFKIRNFEGDTTIVYFHTHLPADSPAVFVLKDLKNDNLQLVRAFTKSYIMPDEQTWFNRFNAEISKRYMMDTLQQDRRHAELAKLLEECRQEGAENHERELVDSMISNATLMATSRYQLYRVKADILIWYHKAGYKQEILSLFDEQDKVDRLLKKPKRMVFNCYNRQQFYWFVLKDSLKNEILKSPGKTKRGAL